MEITIRQIMGHYEIYVNSSFWCSCDNRNEVDEEIAVINRIKANGKMWR